MVIAVRARMIVQRRLPIMTPLEIIRRAQAGTLIDEDGNAVTLELFPGLSDTELQDFANRLLTFSAFPRDFRPGNEWAK